MSALTFDVHDLPAPQGSKRHVGRGILVESSRKVKPWREAVKHAALDAFGRGAFTGPLAVDITFSMPRPRSHYRTGRYAHILRDGAPIAPARLPDLDKLQRSTFDALTAAGVWGDDAQVVEVRALKLYAGTALPFVGARITVDHYARCPVCGGDGCGCGGAA